MRRVKFLVDKSGKKTAVILDLRKNAALWEDIYDSALARSRAGEPRESLASVRRRLQRSCGGDAESLANPRLENTGSSTRSLTMQG